MLIRIGKEVMYIIFPNFIFPSLNPLNKTEYFLQCTYYSMWIHWWVDFWLNIYYTVYMKWYTILMTFRSQFKILTITCIPKIKKYNLTQGRFFSLTRNYSIVNNIIVVIGTTIERIDLINVQLLTRSQLTNRICGTTAIESHTSGSIDSSRTNIRSEF